VLDQALERARATRPDAEAELFELLRIPSISALPEHGGDVERARDWVAGRLEAAGMEVEIAAGVISAAWLGLEGAPVLGLYGHYDVQPPDPLDLWESSPFEPSVRDGSVYARGATDNKGQLVACLRAAELALATGGPPVNLRFLIEGEEEIGGRTLPDFVRDNASRLRTDHMLVADGLFTAPGVPNLVTGLRGLLYVEIEVTGPAADLHSGIYGGAAPNPFNSLAHILSALKGRDGRVRIPGYYDQVRPPAREEVEGWRTLPVNEQRLLAEIGSSALEGEAEFRAVERLWARPTLDVHGVAGGFTGAGQKTVIPSRALAKVSMRLVPDQDPEAILASLRSFATAQATPGVRVEVRPVSYTKPVLCPADTAVAAAARRAYEAAWGAEPVLVREGGSVPVTLELREALGADLAVTGFGLPGALLHSPNEHMSLDQFHRGTEFVLHLMHELA
jgi:acetylornithine deacetylase/succinyl-diaminopimelate desuccinylase-like protein